MNVATIASVYGHIAYQLPPCHEPIQVAAVAMAGGVALTFYSMWGFFVIGWLSGMVMIAQLSFLATASARQGVFMGIFNTASYGGMTAIPFVAGFVAETGGFATAYALTAALALLVAATIGRCGCLAPLSHSPDPGNGE